MNLLMFYNCFFFFFIFLSSLVMMMLPLVMWVVYMKKFYIIYWSMFFIKNSSIDIPIIIDMNGLLTSMVVLFISLNVLRFSMTYMYYESFKIRFSYLVLLFVLSMNLLIYIPNMMMLLIGWDGLGLISFLLVIYYQNSKSLSAGMITALTNRLGDAMLLVSIALMLNMNNWSIMNMWWDMKFSCLIIICLLLGSMTKSAQVPFSSWLPAAMAAPTPVSALVHSSTLVTAGVFLLIRFYNYISMYYYYQMILMFASCLTMMMAAMCAIIEMDLKKIIALSTLSQLGVMMSSLGIGLPNLALFHLMTHALFKALLFVCVGSFIFLHMHNQDLRMVGNLEKQLPFSSSCFLIGSISLCGLPFLSGFYSKDVILEFMLSGIMNMLMMMIIIISTSMTAIYSIRLILVSMMSEKEGVSYSNLTNEDKSIFISMMNLMFGAIFGGCLLNWLFFPINIECFMPMMIKLVPLMVSFIGIFMSVFLSMELLNKNMLLKKLYLIHEFLSMMWFLVPLSSQMLLKFFYPFYMFLKVIDHGWVESFSGEGLNLVFKMVLKKIQIIQSMMMNIMLSVSILSILVMFLSL